LRRNPFIRIACGSKKKKGIFETVDVISIFCRILNYRQQSLHKGHQLVVAKVKAEQVVMTS
jgi:hypothetical protein